MSVTYERDGSARIVVSGELDADAGHALTSMAARIVAEDHPARIELDLRLVTGYTAAGAAAVSAWLALCRAIDGGVGIRVATDAGRRALLECMTQA
jgi:ABC-type transporter Mla MlaB component